MTYKLGIKHCLSDDDIKEAMPLNDFVNQKYAYLNALKGLTPKGARKWHHYNALIN